MLPLAEALKRQDIKAESRAFSAGYISLRAPSAQRNIGFWLAAKFHVAFVARLGSLLSQACIQNTLYTCMLMGIRAEGLGAGFEKLSDGGSMTSHVLDLRLRFTFMAGWLW